jgi:hypothetical protein
MTNCHRLFNYLSNTIRKNNIKLSVELNPQQIVLNMLPSIVYNINVYMDIIVVNVINTINILVVLLVKYFIYIYRSNNNNKKCNK